MIPTGRQLREGRLLTGMSQIALATAAGVRLELITRVELTVGLPLVTRRDVRAIQMALEVAGVEFTFENGGGAGVRLRKAPP